MLQKGLAYIEGQCCGVAVGGQSHVLVGTESCEIFRRDIVLSVRQGLPQVKRRAKVLDVAGTFVPESIAAMTTVATNCSVAACFDGCDWRDVFAQNPNLHCWTSFGIADRLASNTEDRMAGQLAWSAIEN
jgi:hypothetical protein